MPLLYLYLFKLSCSLAVVALFYQFALRRLTFYTSNRWYLFGYSFLSFFMAAINVSGLLARHTPETAGVVRYIPSVAQYATKTSRLIEPNESASFSLWNATLLVLLAGITVLLARLLLQYVSYRKLKKSAQLVTDTDIKVYQVTKPIMPFSFGRSIFINEQLHSQADLQEIIRHEFVHVKQRHTMDIIWAEVLCILNWYNPFAWFLRNAIRQNLEFIADSNVLQSGMDKKQYQYLLLKVTGAPQFRIAAPFSFSSLKKRIIMMNKMKSARAHLVKFLLAVPLIAVLLVAFRNNINDKAIPQNESKTVTISGLIVNAATQQPIQGVSVSEAISKASTTTDARGYFSVAVPADQTPVQTKMSFMKDGFAKQTSVSSMGFKSAEALMGLIEIVGMKASYGKTAPKAFANSIPLFGDDAAVNIKPGYAEVYAQFEKLMQQGTTKTQFENTLPVSGINTNINFITDTIPPPVVKPLIADTSEFPSDFKAFYKRNPDVKSVRMNDEAIFIKLKNGKQETYQRNDTESMAAALKKYGELPVAPPPPPVVVPPPPPAPIPVPVDEDAMVNMQEIEYLRMKIEQLNDTIQNGKNNENIDALRAYLDARSLALQKEQKVLHAYLLQNQGLSEEAQKATQAKLKEREAALVEDQKASHEFLLKNQAVLDQATKRKSQLMLQKIQSANARKQKAVQAHYRKQQETIKKTSEKTSN